MRFELSSSTVRRCAGIVLAVAIVALPSQVAAQGFFSNLFGFVGPKPAPAISPPLRQSPLKLPPASAFSGDRASAQSSPSGEAGGTFRTVCVRTCDGFFVPISYATRRENFMQDQAKCRATCGGEAVLFYHRSPGGNVEDAVDLNGRPYGRLPNAFRFRKTRVEGCACRPPPWSETEIARHQSYALAATNLSTARGTSAASSRVASAGGVTATTAAPSPIAPAEPAAVAAVSNPGKRTFAPRVKTADAPAEQTSVRAASNTRRQTAPVKLVGLERKPQSAVPAQAGSQSSPGSGLFGMGLTKQSKLKWPGD